MRNSNVFSDLSSYSTEFILELKKLLDDPQNVSFLINELNVSSLTIEYKESQIQFSIQNVFELNQLIESINSIQLECV